MIRVRDSEMYSYYSLQTVDNSTYLLVLVVIQAVVSLEYKPSFLPQIE